MRWKNRDPWPGPTVQRHFGFESISFPEAAILLVSDGDRDLWPGPTPISFPEATILLVSDGDRELWPGQTPEVRDSRTSRHSAHAQSQV